MKPLEPTLGDSQLDSALAQLPRADLPPMAANLQLRAARERLQGRRPLTRVERAEPTLLIISGALHLLWVVCRVLELGLHAALW